MLFVAITKSRSSGVRDLIFICGYCKDRYTIYNPRMIDIHPFWINCSYCRRAVAGHLADIPELLATNKLLRKSYLTIPSKTTIQDINDLVFNKVTQNFEIKSEVITRVVMDPNSPPGSIRYHFAYTPAYQMYTYMSDPARVVEDGEV